MLNVSGVNFSYAGKRVISDVSFSAAAGENIAIVGESGCGKSTLLKLVYGLHDLQGGSIELDGVRVTGPSRNLIPGDARMKYLAQDFGLMPFTTAAENVGRHLSNIYPELKRRRVEELLELCEMSEYRSVRPVNLSGGQQQRVAIAMSLAREPKLLLLDEPFSQIDAFRTNSLRRNIFGYCKDRGIICIVATHDATDVLSFADTVIVLKTGRVVAQQTPKALISGPPDFYTAALFGDVSIHPVSKKYLYPHQIATTPVSAWKATVIKSYFKGSHYLVEAVSDGAKVYFNSDAAIPTGAVVFLIEA